MLFSRSFMAAAVSVAAFVFLSAAALGQTSSKTARDQISECQEDLEGDIQSCVNNFPSDADAKNACLDGAKASHQKCLDLIGTKVTITFSTVAVVRETGQPESITIPFTVGKAGTFSLVAVNGTTARRLSSLTVWVDGEKIITPDCLNQNVDMVQAPVQLFAGAHTLRARATSKPEGEVILTFIVMDPLEDSGIPECPRNR